MILKSITCTDFRNYTKKTFQIAPDITVFVGENAHGKTNILEAIYLLATGDSFRAKKTEEMIYFHKEIGRVEGILSEKDQEETIEIVLTRGMVMGTKTLKRQYRVDNTPKRKKDVIDKFACVVFRPEDMDLIVGSPGLRRSFMDSALSQADMRYRESLHSYEQALKRRNALLDLLREHKTTKESFSFWDKLLIRHGNVLTEKRREFFAYLNANKTFPFFFEVDYDASTISEKRLKQYEQEEVMCGYTLVGPHKDDFFVYKQSKEERRNLSLYGSRGEQRIGVLWLKLCELAYLKERAKQQPILLLDDIFSELDEHNQELVLDVVKKQQTIMTTTPDHLDLFSHMKLDMVHV